MATLALLVMLLLIAAGCGGKKEEAEGGVEQETEQETPIVIQEPEPEPEPEEPAVVAPLTGVPRETEAKLRPVAVMINNLAPARPQSGLPHADVVWEVLAEGGITRLIAIFQSDEAYDGAIGPIRSIRPYMIELAESYNAVIVHAGASNDAYAILQRQKKEHLDEITNAGTWFRRDSSRKAPHNLYSDLPNLRTGAEKRGYPADVAIPAFRFLDAAGESAAAGDALEVDIRFQLKNYIVTYRYDAEKRQYLRFINGEPHTDLVSGEQLAAVNLAVLGASHQVLDNEGRLAIDLNAGGPAMLIRHGEAIECTWQRDAGGVIRLVKDGEELPFARGTVYYHIVPDPQSVADHVTIRQQAST
jgi:hypothetical protein